MLGSSAAIKAQVRAEEPNMAPVLYVKIAAAAASAGRRAVT